MDSFHLEISKHSSKKSTSYLVVPNGNASCLSLKETLLIQQQVRRLFRPSSYGSETQSNVFKSFLAILRLKSTSDTLPNEFMKTLKGKSPFLVKCGRLIGGRKCR
jgi:hypothetical protein